MLNAGERNNILNYGESNTYTVRLFQFVKLLIPPTGRFVSVDEIIVREINFFIVVVLYISKR